MSSPEEFASFKRPLEEIVKATNNFDEEIGQGGFGKIYKGNLLVSGKPTAIAARRLHYDYGQGELEFRNEISVLAGLKLKHDNLVSFIGFCDEKDEKIIINEYEANGSLDKHLSSPTLTWMQRLQICVDVAHALHYIHCGDGHESSVIHRNIKSSKILLDENWKPKLSGFEHSKINTRARRLARIYVDQIVGTIGYVDPTYEENGFVTRKSDVYSFGVVLFEVLCGKRASFPSKRKPFPPQYITEYNNKDGKVENLRFQLQPLYTMKRLDRYLHRANEELLAKLAKFRYDMKQLDNIIDPDLREHMNQISYNIFTQTAYSCLKKNPEQRPSIEQICKRLVNALQLQKRHENNLISKEESVVAGGGDRNGDGEDGLEQSVVASGDDGEDGLEHSVVASGGDGNDVGKNGRVEELLVAGLGDNGRVGESVVTNVGDGNDLGNNGRVEEPVIIGDKGREESLVTDGSDGNDVGKNGRVEESVITGGSNVVKNGRVEGPVITGDNGQVKEPVDTSGGDNGCTEESVVAVGGDRTHVGDTNRVEELVVVGGGDESGAGDNGRINNNRDIVSSQEEFARFKRPLQEIIEATGNFAEEIGRGGFGKIYRGNLLVAGEPMLIAARRLHYDYGQGDLEFWNEVSLLASLKLKHDNLVSFIGFCDEGGEKIIINKHEVMGSLNKYLSSPDLRWTQRLQICVDVARALNYIHCGDGHESSVIHRNIKSSKILLGEKWKAKLSGFEHSKTNTRVRRNRLVLADQIVGTIGYVDPTYEKTGFVTHKSDVYSFGVVLFEVLCGRRAFVSDESEPQYFTEQYHKEEKLDDEIANAHPSIGGMPSLPQSYNGPLSKSDVRPPSYYGPASYGDADECRSNTDGLSGTPNSVIGVAHGDVPTQSPFVDRTPSSFVDRTPSSFVDKTPSSFADRDGGPLSSIDGQYGYGTTKPVSFERSQAPCYSDGDIRPPKSYIEHISSASPDRDGGMLSLLADQVWPQPLSSNLDQQGQLLSLADQYWVQPPLLDQLVLQPLWSNLDQQDEGVSGPPMRLKGGVTSDVSDLTTPSPANVSVLPRKSYSSKEQRFELKPLYTMKRLDRYTHSPNEELLAELARSRYDDENLDEIIDQALWEQMNPESFEIFSKTAYNCLKEKRVQRPNIDQILGDLEEALQLQITHENPKESGAAGKDEETTPNHTKGQLEYLKIPFIDIEVATNNFKNKPIGTGGYGNVYKAELEVPIKDKTTGEISRKRRTVAIKCIRQDEQGKRGFYAEIELLTSCKDPNVVSLLGFCDEGTNLILVYEHAANKSLDDYLGSTGSSSNLTWVQRINIGIDIARGLNYMHTMVEGEQRIIHLDIKSGNILLGKNWAAKIADFGLSRIFHRTNQQEVSVYTGTIAGTEYYMCPEYKDQRNNGRTRLKTAVDIYSLGVILFELMSGKLAYDQKYLAEDTNGIASVARQRFKDGRIHEMVDVKIIEEVDELTSTLHKGPNQHSLKTYIEVAHKCVATTQDGRPTAKDIVEELKKALSLQENNKDTLQLSFEEIKSATQDFQRENFIGGGGFGKVHKGKVKRSNGSTTIVAKRLDRSKGQGDHHFLMELEILFEYKHENIIGLEGYCNEKDEKIIVYEYASKISLDKYLKDVSLTWTQRLKICIDIARGLAYLHGGAPTKETVIHRDIKSANILLKGDWKAKISDFGLSAITPRNEKVVSKLVGTIGYVDPQFEITGFFTEKSDIYSLGVLLFEVLNGKLLVPNEKGYDQQRVTRFLKQIHEEEKVGSIVFEGIKEKIDPQSLSAFRVIVSQCLHLNRKKRPTAEEVLKELEKSLEFQEDYEIWGPNLPKDYDEILKSSTYSENYSSKTKKDLYNLLSKGILLQDDKVWFSLRSNGERTEGISAEMFTYKNHSPHDMWYIVPESRFQKVAKMLDISNLMIKIKTKTQFLSQDTIYGVHLVFKFCDTKNLSWNPMYVDLKYRKGSKTLHAYFAQCRDDKWMAIELYRFLNQKDGVVLEFLLESFSHCRNVAIYVEGIEFRVINNVGHDETNKSKEIKQVMRSTFNVDRKQELPIESAKIFKRTENYDEGGKEFFLISEVNEKKHLMILAKAIVHNFSDLKLFKSKPSVDSRYEDALELLPQLVFRISCTIGSQMLSQDTEYVCYLVFKLSEKCHRLHCPVEVQDLLKNNKTDEIVYFRTPRPWNIHDITRVPKQREDGWMEVNIWKFNSTLDLKNEIIPVNLKLVSYEGHMSGLIVYGLECRPA